MAREVNWAYEAAADIEALAEYIARDSAFYASAFVQEIRDASRSLNELPGRGRIVPELGNPNIRELFVRGYRLIYGIEESRIVNIRPYPWQKRFEKVMGERKEKDLTVNFVYLPKVKCHTV